MRGDLPSAKIKDATVHFEVPAGDDPDLWDVYEGDIRMVSNGFVDLLESGQMVAPHRIQTIDYDL